MSTRTASWLMFDIKRQQVALTHGRSPPAHWGPGSRAALVHGWSPPRPLGAGDGRAALARGRSPPCPSEDVFLCISGYVDCKKGI